MESFDDKSVAIEIDALRELWQKRVGIGAEYMDFGRIHRSFGYAICSDAFARAGKKLYNCPSMTPIDICRYACGTAKNIAIAVQNGIKPLPTNTVNYTPQYETR